jgi:glycosyltransferase involved in cell wall biosynthesis
MAAMEATIAGTPVLAPDDGGPIARRAARGGGLLVDATDAGSVAAALGQLDPVRLQELRSDALALAPTLFADAETAARRLVDVLETAAASRKRSLGRAGAGR